jgi:hypothetical protein
MTRSALVLVLACACSGSRYASAVLDDHPVGYWRLGDPPGATFARDDSGHSHDAVIVGAITLGAGGALAGESATAAKFARDQWISAGDNFGFTNGEAFTLELWLSPDAVDIWRPIVIKGDYFSGADGYVVMTNNNAIVVQSQWAANQSGTSLPMTPGTWIHLAITFAGLDLDMYLDGVLAKHDTISQRWDPSPVPFTIAGPDDGVHGGGSYQGTMQEVAVYDRALTADRIAAHYAASR